MFTPDSYNLLMLALPLLFVDWQLGLLWGFASQNAAFVALMVPLDFGGFEVWFVFLVAAVMRLFLFRGR